jgi:hypothetical protein
VWGTKAGGNGLFDGYVDKFLKLKAESSGWPALCASAEQRAAYVREFEEREGVALDPAQMEQPNPGLRQIAVYLFT